MDMEADFSVEQADEETILVRHCQEAHRYAFFIVAQDGRAISAMGSRSETTRPSMTARASGRRPRLRRAAARERKLID